MQEVQLLEFCICLWSESTRPWVCVFKGINLLPSEENGRAADVGWFPVLQGPEFTQDLFSRFVYPIIWKIPDDPLHLLLILLLSRRTTASLRPCRQLQTQREKQMNELLLMADTL